MPLQIVPDLLMPSLLSPGLTQAVEFLPINDEGDNTAVNVTDGTYTLYDSAGTVIATVGSVAGTGGAQVSVTLDADVPVGRYREVFSDLVLSSGTILSVTREAWVTSAPLFPLITTVRLSHAHPQLGTFPENRESWGDQIALAWALTVRRAVRMGKAWLSWDASALADVHWYHTLELIFRAEATYGESSWMQMAREYATMKEDAWADLRMVLDTDGDGDVDDTSYQSSEHGGFPARAPVRG